MRSIGASHKLWTTQELEYLFIFCRAKREFFFQNFILGYMTKTLNYIIIFILHQNQNIIFQLHWESEYLFKKTITPPPWKLNGPSLGKKNFPQITFIVEGKITDAGFFMVLRSLLYNVVLLIHWCE